MNGYGYSIGGIKELASNILANYKVLGETIQQQWPYVRNALKDNWKGTDELSFEHDLAERVVKLYQACGGPVRWSASVIYTMGQNWIDFQNNNKLSYGDGSVSSADYSSLLRGQLDELTSLCTQLQDEDANRVEIDVTAEDQVTFSETDFLGLQNDSAGVNIDTALFGFVTEVNQKANALYSNFANFNTTGAGAFVGGNQEEQISEFLKALGGKLGDLSTAVDDFRDILTKPGGLQDRYNEHIAQQNTGGSEGMGLSQATETLRQATNSGITQ